MRIDDLAHELKRAYETAAEKEKVVAIHLFGNRFAEALQTISAHVVAERAGLPRSYGTEIRKGVNLARYVTPNS